MAFLKAMGLKESIQTIYLAVVNCCGLVWASAEGDYSSEKAAVPVKALP